LTDSTEGLDPKAIEFEKKIFLRSDKGRALFTLLVNGLPKGAPDFTGIYARNAADSTLEAAPFDKITVRYNELVGGWTISGYVLKTNMVYSLSVSEEELKYRV
jgi:hypothetical protein